MFAAMDSCFGYFGPLQYAIANTEAQIPIDMLSKIMRRSNGL